MKVNLDLQAFPVYNQRADLELSTKGSAWDFLNVTFIYSGRWVGAGWFTNLEEFLRDPNRTEPDWDPLDFVSGSMAPLVDAKGNRYGFPWEAGTMMLGASRGDLIEKAGLKLPETFDDLLKVCEAVHDKEGVKAFVNDNLHHWHWIPYLMGFGGKVFRDPPEDLTPTLDTPEAARAAEYYTDLLRKYGPPGVLSTLEHYLALWATDFGRSFVNSAVASVSATLLALIIGVPAAYALSRGRFKREKSIALWILASRMAPPIAFTIPFFLLYRHLGLLDSLAGLVIIYLTFNLSLVIWMMRTFFDGTPRSLEEAAWIVRQAVGSEVIVLADGNQAWGPERALVMARFLADHDVRWLEEPVPSTEPELLAQVARRSPVPIAAGENVYGREAFRRFFAARALRIAQPDVTKTGGISEAKVIADMAGAWRIRVAPHFYGGAVGMAATLHFFAAVSDGLWIEWDTQPNPLRDALITREWEVRDGHVRLPSGPGLGIELDPAGLERFRVA